MHVHATCMLYEVYHACCTKCTMHVGSACNMHVVRVLGNMHADSTCCGVECALFRKHYMAKVAFSFTFESVIGGASLYGHPS